MPPVVTAACPQSEAVAPAAPAPADDARNVWHVAQLRQGCEPVARQNLERQGFGVFAPFEEVSVRRGQRFQSVRKPLFPGYMFVSLSPDPARWRSANATYGVTRLVGFQGNRPAPISSDFMAALKARCDGAGKLLPIGQFREQDQVRIVSGPLAGFVATIETIAPRNRIWVLLDSLEQVSRISVPAEDLRFAS